jgi:hypothetical protein
VEGKLFNVYACGRFDDFRLVDFQKPAWCRVTYFGAGRSYLSAFRDAASCAREDGEYIGSEALLPEAIRDTRCRGFDVCVVLCLE